MANSEGIRKSMFSFTPVRLPSSIALKDEDQEKATLERLSKARAWMRSEGKEILDEPETYHGREEIQ